MSALALSPIRRLVPRPTRLTIAWTAVTATLVLAVGLVAAAGFPTGRPTPEGVVPRSARLAAQTQVAGVHVLLTVEGGQLVGVVAYDGDKGWLGVELDPVAGATPAAWAATSGSGPVPALSTVFGRVSGERVVVEWADGSRDTAVTARDGAYVVAREGRVDAARVVVFDGSGEVVYEVSDL